MAVERVGDGVVDGWHEVGVSGSIDVAVKASDDWSTFRVDTRVDAVDDKLWWLRETTKVGLAAVNSVGVGDERLVDRLARSGACGVVVSGEAVL